MRAEFRQDLGELHRQMNERFDRVNERFDRVNERFDQMSERFIEMERHFEGRFEEMHRQMLVQTRWLIGSLTLIGTVISVLLAIAQFTP